MLRWPSVVLLSSIAAAAIADDVPDAVQACAVCHGVHGEGTAQGPVLAGLSASYISAQVANFNSRRRSNSLMGPMAEAYASAELLQPAAIYFAAQGKPPPILQVRGQNLAATPAEKLYYQGDMARDIPACFSCHGPSAIGGGPFPRLAGQQAAYLEAQLHAWRKGERSGDPDGMMAAIAQRLNDKDITALASYLAAIR
ncbi:c-type cytochrome [Pseudomonas sp. PSE14]|uniref:c-type cytochrome n=1 Tax=Pseudomonas sp. PSE14 TaxID=3016341 RepID=UPI0023D88938|nr:c-type cytochrome [Pseudomonas sp. PSE14]WEJ70031.1 c-type cytochrome [Pseudomonas sp. PSE14]